MGMEHQMGGRSSVGSSGHTILVVDDQEEVLTSVRHLLEREGHRVLTAESGERALALFKLHDVHLCLVDHFMPRTTGGELVREIRTFDPSVPIIIQTGYFGEGATRGVLSALDVQGCHDKTDGPEKLLEWVNMGLKAYVQPSAAQPSTRHRRHESVAKTLKVLLVGEQQAFAWLASQLTRQGRQVLMAEDCGTALDLFVRQRAHVMALDEAVMDRGGVDLVRRARALDSTLPVIVVSSGLNAQQRRRVHRDLDPHGIHYKNDGPERLVEIVESAVGLTHRLESARADQLLRSLILAKFCHDVRNLIHVIHGYSELLCRDLSGSPKEGVLTRLGDASGTALGLVQHYLDLARLESPGLTVRREPVAFDELIADLRELAERAIGERPVQLVTTVPLFGAVVHSDGEKLRAILAELLTNAIKFSTEGQVRLDIRAVHDGTEFVVRDAGPGLEDDELSLLFDPFRQSSEQAFSSTPGQGLGLAIALRLSALLGGRLTATRGTHGGAVFTLSLPVMTEAKGAPGELLQ